MDYEALAKQNGFEVIKSIIKQHEGKFFWLAKGTDGVMGGDTYHDTEAQAWEACCREVNFLRRQITE